jgi:hypothetical protein
MKENIRVLEKFNDGSNLTHEVLKEHKEALDELLKFKSQFNFIIETLEESIAWAEYADDYFKQKHNLDIDKENVRKCVEILNEQLLNDKNLVQKSLF